MAVNTTTGSPAVTGLERRILSTSRPPCTGISRSSTRRSGACAAIAASASWPLDVVLSFGGIGATPDDHTRQCAADALGVPLALHPDAEREIRARFGDEITPQRLRMGEFPQGCAIIPNPFNRIPGFSIRDHHFVPGFPQMAWPMIEWVLDTQYRALFDRDRWAEASIVVYECGESQLIPAMVHAEKTYPGLKAFSLPSMGPNATRRHVELGVRGAPAQIEPAIEDMRRIVTELGFPFEAGSTYRGETGSR
jgi:molybdopterin-biosynthesis enzyme MoeA-like protein